MGALSGQQSCLSFGVQVKEIDPLGLWIRQGQGRGWFQILVFSLQRFVLYLMDHAEVRAALMPTAWAH